MGGGRIAPISACSPLLKALQSCPLRKEGMARGSVLSAELLIDNGYRAPQHSRTLAEEAVPFSRNLQKSVCLPHRASSSECLLCLLLEAWHWHLLMFSCRLLPVPMALCSGSDCNEAKHVQPQPANAPALLFAVRLQGRPQAPANPHLC